MRSGPPNDGARAEAPQVVADRGDGGVARPLPFQDVLSPSDGVVAVEIVCPVEVGAGRSRGVFQGKIEVARNAQKTDGYQMNQALLLSPYAEVDCKPELEIFADDVTCGHGATSGALDESLLFYLRARGLPEKDAQALLIQAFVGEAIEGIADDDLREAVMAAAARWLEARA